MVEAWNGFGDIRRGWESRMKGVSRNGLGEVRGSDGG